MKNVIIKTNERGITLITLIVTIIVLTILTGITFSTFLGENGVLDLARNETDIAQKRVAKEKLRIEVAGSKKNNGEYVAENIEKNINAHIDNKRVIRHQFPMVVEVDGYTFAIDNQGRILEPNFNYLVEFDGNGAVGTMNSQEFLFNIEKNLETNKYNREGYTFACWNTQPDGNGIKFDNEELVSNLTEEEYGVIVLYAQWAKGIAEVNGVHYDTLQEAIDAVPTNNVRTTVKLLTNTKENISIKANQNILLDLQNHTLSIRDYGNLAVVENSGTIEITNGTIKSNSTKTATINNNSGGKLKISSGKILMEATAGKQALYNNGGIVEITGTAYLSSASSNAAGNNKRATVQNLANSTLKITGGTIISSNYTGIENSGAMTIGTNNGTASTNAPIICGAEFGIYLEKISNKFNFYDGIIKGKKGILTINKNTEESNIEEYIQDKEADYVITSSNEIINGATYKTAYLASVSVNATVTFNTNAGNMSEEITKIIEKGNTIGAIMSEVQEPTRSNYKFVGWFTESEEGTQITAETIVNADVTYYAHWWPMVTVTFATNANDATLNETTRAIPSGQPVGELPTPTRPNYDFVGWFTVDSGGTQITAQTEINTDVTYYAHWMPMPVVTFNKNANNAILSETTRTVSNGQPVGALPEPTRDKYDFVGWFTKSSGGTQITAQTEINANVTYYAHWEKIMYAQMNGINYDTVTTALKNVPKDSTYTIEPTTITLNRDTVEVINIETGKNVIIELANHTLSVGTNKAVIENNGKLTIKSGTVSSIQTTGTINNNNGATLIIDGARIEGKERSAIYNNSGGTVYIQGDSHISSEASGKATTSQALERGAIHNLSGGTVYITGGTIEGKKVQAVSNMGTMTIGTEGDLNTENPVFIGKTYGIRNTGTLQFYDGIAKGEVGGIDSSVAIVREPNTQMASGKDGKYNTNYLEPIQ